MNQKKENKQNPKSAEGRKSERSERKSIKYRFKKQQKKINKIKSWFFEQVYKIDKPLNRLTKKRREKPKLKKIRNEKGEATMDIQKYKKP